MCEQAGYLKRESYVLSFHVLESVSWKGYKLVYAKGYDYEYYCCRDLNKVGL